MGLHREEGAVRRATAVMMMATMEARPTHE
jgi:hypothetical protein